MPDRLREESLKNPSQICSWVRRSALCASPPLSQHTPAAHLRPSHSRQRHRKPTGYHMTPPSSLHRSYKSYKSYASVTPTQHAYRRCHQKSPAYPCGKSAPGYAPRTPPLSSYPHTPTYFELFWCFGGEICFLLTSVVYLHRCNGGF